MGEGPSQDGTLAGGADASCAGMSPPRRACCLDHD